MLDLSRLAFVAIPIGLLVALMAGVRHAWQAGGASGTDATRASALVGIVGILWMAGTWTAAESGVLTHWDWKPPTFLLIIVATFVMTGWLAFGRVGFRLARFVPLWVLIGVQGFRLPLELAMHEMANRHIMPSVLSYSGRNFDILTGVTAILVAGALRFGYGGGRLALVWNWFGLALLVNVVVVALLATPVFEYFGPEQLNTWVTLAPFVWLPTVMVLAALAGHLIVFRAVVGGPAQ